MCQAPIHPVLGTDETQDDGGVGERGAAKGWSVRTRRHGGEAEERKRGHACVAEPRYDRGRGVR
jgi:hypothetical protein